MAAAHDQDNAFQESRSNHALHRMHRLRDRLL